MPSSLVPPRHPDSGSVATTGFGSEAGRRPSHTSAGGACWNAAPTEVSDVRVIEQACDPEHAPLQPEKLQPASGRTSRATDVPSANCAEHVAPQSIPDGVETTRPDPFKLTRSACIPGAVVWKVAFTVASAVIGTTQLPVPEHAPPQPAKLAPDPAVAVSVTACEKVALQVEPQSIPAGEEDTFPLPETSTASAWEVGVVEPGPWLLC